MRKNLKTEQINIRLTRKLHAEIKQGAVLTGRSVSGFVGMAVTTFLMSPRFERQAQKNLDKLKSLLEDKP